MAFPTRVALVEDHAVLAEALAISLSLEGFQINLVPLPHVKVPSMSLLAPLLDLRPDIVLLDLDLGQAGDGALLVEPLTRESCSVLVLTGSGDLARWGECLARGALGVLPKESPLEDIVKAIRLAAAGDSVMPQSERTELVHRWHRHRVAEDSLNARLDRLSRREEEILAGLMEGKRVRDLAAEGWVSEATVRTQVKSIFAKLGVTSQIGAVAVAREAGWSARRS